MPRASDLSEEGIRRLLKGGLGSQLVLLPEAASTNDVAAGLAEKGAPHGTVVMADSQSRGRGRRGRQWASPPGMNIHMSLVLRPGLHPRDSFLLTAAASVATASASRRLTGAGVGIKWPNDLVAPSGRKLGGILLETRTDSGRLLYCILGLGLNVNSVERDFPPELRGLATSLCMETGSGHDRSALAAGILGELDARLGELEGSGREGLLEKWKGLSVTLGREVRVDTGGGGSFTGLAEDLDARGRLLVRTADGGLRTVGAGDVETLRPA